MEIDLVRAARQLKIPTLCICRGIQIANIAFGGTLITDIADRLQERATIRHIVRDAEGGTERRLIDEHVITIEPDSTLAGIVGTTRLVTGTRHHQAVDRCADDLRIVARTADGIVEALEARFESPFWLAVQWHPESTRTTDDASRKIFTRFVDAARHDAVRPVTMVLPPAEDDVKGDDRAIGTPRRVSLTKIRRIQREQKRQWDVEHMLPLRSLILATVPSTSLRLYGRWWQLERWLKDLLHLELHCKFGSRWKDKLAASLTRQSRDAITNKYMPSADDTDPLSFASLDELRRLIAENWDLVSYSLLPQVRWEGAIDTLAPVRNRLGHMRRLHASDIARVENVLHDLESGACHCLETYQRDEWPDESESSIVARAWGRNQPTKRGTIEHAYSNYETTMRLGRMRRPWADSAAIAGPGILWTVEWHTGKRIPDPSRVWEAVSGSPALPHLVHLSIYYERSYRAVITTESDAEAASLVDDIFTAIIHAQTPGVRMEDTQDFRDHYRDLDYRVRVDDLFARASDIYHGSIFGLKS